MKVQITVTDQAGNTVTWTGTEDDQFDCWELEGQEPSTLGQEAHAMVDALQAAAYNAHQG
jgi:hypothetical protein